MTKDEANALFQYRDGNLYYKTKQSRKVNVGDKVGSLNGDGYMRTTINYRQYRIHRIIFLMHHGWVPDLIDHIDGNPSNNRIENLRAATKTQNAMNARRRKDNSSGVKGVSWFSRLGKWRAYITIDRRHIEIGYYNTKDEAEVAAVAARKAHHKDFFRE